ncbi:hypothetical protein IAU60_004569 [Kwoniella sp. DSM 27419]
MGLLQACTHIALMSGTGDPIVQQAQIAFYETLRRSNASLRFEVWWTVYRQSDDLDLAKDTDFAKAVFLLSPSDPRAPIPLITHPALASHATRWYQQVASNPDKSAQLRSLLQRDAEVPTRKRKRSSDIPRTILKTVYPHVEANEDIGKTLLKEPRQSILTSVYAGLTKSDRSLRIVAGRALSLLFGAQEEHPNRDVADKNRLAYIAQVHAALSTYPVAQETSVLLFGDMGRQAVSGSLGRILQHLLLNLAKHHNKTPYNLLSPYFEPISIFLVENLARHPDMLTETMQFIGDTRQAFLGRTTDYTLPAMVLSRNRHALDLIASIVDTRLGVLLMDKIADILARAFLSPRQTSSSLAFLVKTIQGMTSGHAKSQPIISASSLMTACIVDFLTKLIVELGDELKSSEEAARTALEKARQQQGNVEDLGVYLKPQMLGVISQLNDMLHDVRGKKSVEFKRKVIRSLGRLIEAVGDSMASFSPQYFNEKEKHIAKNIIDTIADSANSLSQFIDDVVGMDGIPELKGPANKLLAQRKRPGVKESIIKVLDRADSKNIAIATASFRELRSLLLLRQNAVENFARGDAFDPVMARVMSSLLAAAARDGECQELRDISYECLGIIGALDPDRLAVKTDNGSMTLASNFTEQEESKDFAVHLIRDLLVDAFRATNDTKHQTHLAYAIQELLKYCGLTTKVLTMTDRKSKVVDRWHSLPKDQLETLTPLLESRFSYTDAPVKISKHPIYSETPTYREWLQRWTTDLIGKVMSMAGDGIAIRDSKTIFGAFRGVLRNQDVTVAHHILPHLVLNVLLSGMPTYREEICLEINVVLQDQVNPKGPADKRALSAPVIFNLMDHLSKWLMLFKVGKPERASNTKIVESVLSGVETELMANAALQSRAYARSLRSFEQRIIQLRNEKRENSELQAYFERLHQIYAELDEPDGMEGVSAFVISPSLEHQIREHESTGRWTSAQSCWEVRLQQSPDDVTLHVGLLKCLRNLGHYGCALLALHEHRELRPILLDTRRTVGLDITAKEYGRAHEPLLQLHLLREIEMIHAAKCEIESTTTNPNRNALVQAHSKQLISSLNARFAATSPAFRIREAILSLRRTAYGLINMPSLNSEIGDAWTLTSKIARKAGYDQTAYSAVLQAKEADAPFAFIQQAKLLRAHGGVFKALSDVDNALQPMLKNDAANSDESRDFARDRNLAKMQSEGPSSRLFTLRMETDNSFESPYYHLGHYYDTLHGTAEQLHPEAASSLNKINGVITKARKELPMYQDPTVGALVRDANKLSNRLLRFTDDRAEEKSDKRKQMSMETHYAYMKDALPTRMILPLQDALTCALPSTSETVLSHTPFPVQPVEIAGFEDRVDIMQSLQKPKKLVFIGSDGKRYPFLCKPHDDLRKDARLMDLNSMINKLLKSGSESRRRQLFFHEWFLNTWPEPSAWLASRTNYGRTLAVMSMIGYVLGHGENILFDGLSGDTVHVDLNCLFDKVGVFRKAAEISMGILRSNSDSLMSVLEAFVHDPLVEWIKHASADKNLKPIKSKLRGIMAEGTVMTVPNQVESLIKQATSPANLSAMYIGWASWL